MNFFDEIKQENESLYKYLNNEIEKIIQDLDAIDKVFSEYTDHSVNHSKRVLDIAYRLDTPESELNTYEKAIIVLVSYFHDLGMVVTEHEFTEYIEKQKKEEGYSLLLDKIKIVDELSTDANEIKDHFLGLAYFREEHGNRSANKILSLYPDNQEYSYFEKNIYFWDAVALISKSHTFYQKQMFDNAKLTPSFSIGNGVTVDVTYLSCLLRLADICHYSKDRAFPYFKESIDFISKKSEKIWDYYADIVDTIPNPKKNNIEIKASCKNFYNHRAIINNSHAIHTELDFCHKFLTSKNSDRYFKWKYIDTSDVLSLHDNYRFFDTKFSLNHKKIINLLMGDKLYSNEYFAIRECIQNAYDSVNAYIQKVKKNDSYIVIEINEDASIIDVYDNGTGMDIGIINNHFLSIGEDSFWYSTRGIKDWGGFKRNSKLIADHGIGVLSYFMTAEKIEVFSQYYISGDFIHVYIDNYQDGIIFKTTPISDYPKFNGSIDKLSPWEEKHGSCVRFHLKKNLYVYEFIKFLAKHIIRIKHSLIISYKEVKELNQIWHFNNELGDYSLPKYRYFNDMFHNEQNKEKSFQSALQVYDEPKRDFYSGPPHDNSIEDIFYEQEDSFRFNIYLKYSNDNDLLLRVSQNGILIERAIDFFIDFENHLFLNAYSVDLDVCNNFSFQLNADRSEIIKNLFNKEICNKLLKEFDKAYLQQIKKIEASIFFSCGNNYYHGFKDFLEKHSDPHVYFHEVLFEVFQIDKEWSIKFLEKNIDFFKFAKIYNVGLDRISTLCINDIMENDIQYDIFIFLDLVEYLGENAAEMNRMENDKFHTYLHNVGNIVMNLDNLIYTTFDKKSFLLPLAINFTLKKKHQNKEFIILSLVKNKAIDIKRNISVLKNLYKEIDNHNNAVQKKFI